MDDNKLPEGWSDNDDYENNLPWENQGVDEASEELDIFKQSNFFSEQSEVKNDMQNTVQEINSVSDTEHTLSQDINMTESHSETAAEKKVDLEKRVDPGDSTSSNISINEKDNFVAEESVNYNTTSFTEEPAKEEYINFETLAAPKRKIPVIVFILGFLLLIAVAVILFIIFGKPFKTQNYLVSDANRIELDENQSVTSTVITEKTVTQTETVPAKTSAVTSVKKTEPIKKTEPVKSEAKTETLKTETQPPIQAYDASEIEKVSALFYVRLNQIGDYEARHSYNNGYIFDADNNGLDELLAPIHIDAPCFEYSYYKNGSLKTDFFGHFINWDTIEVYRVDNRYIYFRDEAEGISSQGYFGPDTHETLGIYIKYENNNSKTYADWFIYYTNPQNRDYIFNKKIAEGYEEVSGVYAQPDKCHIELMNKLNQYGFDINESSSYSYTSPEPAEQLIKKSADIASFSLYNNAPVTKVIGNGHVKIQSGVLNLRLLPSTDSMIINTLPKDTEFTVYDYMDNWLYVGAYMNGMTHFGFISADYAEYNLHY